MRTGKNRSNNRFANRSPNHVGVLHQGLRKNACKLRETSLQIQTLSDSRVDVPDLRSYHDSAPPRGCVENPLTQTQGFWCRFHVFVDVDVLDGALESHAERRFQLDALAFALGTHVRKVFRLAGIHWQIFWPRVFAYDHSSVKSSCGPMKGRSRAPGLM